MSGDSWDKVLPDMTMATGSLRKTGMKWNDVDQEHVGKQAKVSERVVFGKESWFNVYAGTIGQNQEGAFVLTSGDRVNHFFPWDYDVELVE